MKKTKFLLSLSALFILNCNIFYSQNNGFDPLDPLGSEYGGINQPRLDSRSYEAFEGDKLRDPEINFPDDNDEDFSTNTRKKQANRSEKTHTNQDENYIANNDNSNLSTTEQLDQYFQENSSQNQHARIQTYDAEALNFDRYKNSPCYDKIGFNPTWDMASLERRYSECEDEHYTKMILNVLYILVFVTIVGVVIFFSMSKERRNQFLKKMPKP